MHFLLQRDEADHSNLKLEFVERRFKSKIAEIVFFLCFAFFENFLLFSEKNYYFHSQITEREELLLRVKSVEQKLADAQDLIEKSGLEKVEGPLMNGGESDL